MVFQISMGDGTTFFFLGGKTQRQKRHTSSREPLTTTIGEFADETTTPFLYDCETQRTGLDLGRTCAHMHIIRFFRSPMTAQRPMSQQRTPRIADHQKPKRCCSTPQRDEEEWGTPHHLQADFSQPPNRSKSTNSSSAPGSASVTACTYMSAMK